MREQEPSVRARNYEEVSYGYSKEEAVLEASRCLQCKNPLCVGGCPVGVPIPEFIGAIHEGDFDRAIDVIKTANSLPAVCGRVCPQEEQCEKQCVLGRRFEPVAIGRLERFAADQSLAKTKEPQPPKERNGHKVAVVGAGPAGLTCAGELNQRGYDVTIFEAFHAPGGVLVYGIPEFRLPKALVQNEVDQLISAGVKLELNTVVGRSVTIDELMEEEGFEAVFVGSGAGLPKFMEIPGENLNGVYSANEFLTRINLMKAFKADSQTPIKRGKKVVVVGGGNVAMDAARCALRLGADEVHIVYRRSIEEMPARKEEVHHAQQEGIIFDILTNPVRVIGESGWVTGIECIKMTLGEPDASGRRRPVEQAGSEFIAECDIVIMALGTTPNPLIASTTEGLETTRWGGIVVNEDTMATKKHSVYAGGDAVTGAATVILAMGAGKTAAKAIDEAISN
jgi:glutamate synthase (NADPH/NADH) small chain